MSQFKNVLCGRNLFYQSKGSFYGRHATDHMWNLKYMRTCTHTCSLRIQVSNEISFDILILFNLKYIFHMLLVACWNTLRNRNEYHRIVLIHRTLPMAFKVFFPLYQLQVGIQSFMNTWNQMEIPQILDNSKGLPCSRRP